MKDADEKMQRENVQCWYVNTFECKKAKKPESTIVLNVNKHSNDAAAAKFKLKEETFAKEFIK